MFREGEPLLGEAEDAKELLLAAPDPEPLLGEIEDVNEVLSVPDMEMTEDEGKKIVMTDGETLEDN